jgi:ABC-type antimicrobial peptide transport system permease subunit
VVLVSARLAQSLWPGQDALGQLMIDTSEPGRSLEVIGVARDTRPGLFFDADYLFYKVRGPRNMEDTLLARFSGDPDALALAIRKTVRELEPQVVPAPRTMQSLVEFTTDHVWRATRVILLVAVLPVLMSVISIYGVAAFAVAQRTKEIGIRMALGAGRGQVIRLVLGSASKPIAWGLFCGALLSMVASMAISRATRGAPFTIDTNDPMAYFGAVLLLALTTTIAVIGPARRAATADPVKALRHE